MTSEIYLRTILFLALAIMSAPSIANVEALEKRETETCGCEDITGSKSPKRYTGASLSKLIPENLMSFVVSRRSGSSQRYFQNQWRHGPSRSHFPNQRRHGSREAGAKA